MQRFVSADTSGLSTVVASLFTALNSVPALGLVAIVTYVIIFLTEITSNMATASIVVPILAATGISVGLHPLSLVLPATLACSCAFMLPTATVPNAVVFATDRISR
jgi:sodium-dependent dicarboxylate transporter 2/3/5